MAGETHLLVSLLRMASLRSALLDGSRQSRPPPATRWKSERTHLILASSGGAGAEEKSLRDTGAKAIRKAALGNMGGGCCPGPGGRGEEVLLGIGRTVELANDNNDGLGETCQRARVGRQGFHPLSLSGPCADQPPLPHHHRHHQFQSDLHKTNTPSQSNPRSSSWHRALT